MNHSKLLDFIDSLRYWWLCCILMRSVVLHILQHNCLLFWTSLNLLFTQRTTFTSYTNFNLHHLPRGATYNNVLSVLYIEVQFSKAPMYRMKIRKTLFPHPPNCNDSGNTNSTSCNCCMLAISVEYFCQITWKHFVRSLPRISLLLISHCCTIRCYRILHEVWILN